jgi:hypothetical protein
MTTTTLRPTTDRRRAAQSSLGLAFGRFWSNLNRRQTNARLV